MIIKLFASIREKIGQDQIIIENESLKNIDDVINYFWKNFNIDIGNCMFACNLEYINKDFEIEPNQEISIIPPVSGGSDNDLVEITQNQIDTKNYKTKKYKHNGAELTSYFNISDSLSMSLMANINDPTTQIISKLDNFDLCNIKIIEQKIIEAAVK